jgi:hypothetical protein
MTRESGVSNSSKEEDVAVRVYASFVRVLEQVPADRKLGVYMLMARSGAADVDTFRQAQVDSLWHVADAIGLVRLIGTSSIQDALASAFAGGAS